MRDEDKVGRVSVHASIIFWTNLTHTGGLPSAKSVLRHSPMLVSQMRLKGMSDTFVIVVRSA